MDILQYQEKLHTWFLDHEIEMMERLKTIVNMSSFSHDGEDVNKVGEQLILWMDEAGFIVEKIEKEKPFNFDESMDWVDGIGNVFVARTHPKEKGAGLVFLGHMDTVFPKNNFWSFSIDEKTNKAYGPGIIDMKGGIIVNMYVARALKELNIVNTPITLTFSPDEEIGSPTTLPVLKKQLHGAIAAICTEPGYLNGGITIERKGAGHARVRIEGISAHAGRNYADGSSAILELSHKILAYNKHVNLDQDETVNVGIISGGSSANSIAPYAEGAIHITYKTTKNGEKLLQKIQRETEKTYIKGTKSFLSGGLGLPPLEANENNNKLFEFAENAGRAIGYPVFPNSAKGAAESGFCSSVLGIPSICSMGPEGEFLHSNKEYMNIASLIPRCQIVVLTAIQAVESFG